MSPHTFFHAMIQRCVYEFALGVKGVYLIRTSYAKSGKMKSFIRECQTGKKRYNDRDEIIENYSRNEQALNHGG